MGAAWRPLFGLIGRTGRKDAPGVAFGVGEHRGEHRGAAAQGAAWMAVVRGYMFGRGQVVVAEVVPSNVRA